jgi:hypothetical protein
MLTQDCLRRLWPRAPALIDDWRAEIMRLWSMRVAMAGVAFWSALGGLWVLWPALIDVLPLGFYIGAGLAIAVAVGIARVLKQPGLDQ